MIHIYCIVRSCHMLWEGVSLPQYLYLLHTVKKQWIFILTQVQNHQHLRHTFQFPIYSAGKIPPLTFSISVYTVQYFSLSLVTSPCCFSSFFCTQQSFYARMSIMDIVVHIFYTSVFTPKNKGSNLIKT